MTGVPVSFVLMGVCGFIAAGVAQSERLPLVAVVCLACGLAWLAGAVVSKPRLRLSARFPGKRQWYVGDNVNIALIVTNDGRHSCPVSSVILASPGLVFSPLVLPELRVGETAEIRQSLPLERRRGPAAVRVMTATHHRLIGKGVRLVGNAATVEPLPSVRPRPDLPPAYLLERLTRPTDDGHGNGRRGSADPLLLREYARGDSVSSVHWRSTARIGRPVVLEREQPVTASVTLVVAHSGDGDAWEAAVARAAGLVQAAQQLAVPVQVIATAPAQLLSGAVTHERVQDWLAGLSGAGPGDMALVAAVARAPYGLIAVLSSEPALAQTILGTVAGSGSVASTPGGSPGVLDLIAAPW